MTNAIMIFILDSPFQLSADRLAQEGMSIKPTCPYGLSDG
jgi:hypothetical protein